MIPRRLNLISGAAAVFLAGCLPSNVAVKVAPQATSTPTENDGAYVVRQPAGTYCSVGVSGWDFDDPRYANAKFICPMATGFNLILRTKPNDGARDMASRYLVDGSLETTESLLELALWANDIYLYPPTGLVGYDYRIDGNTLVVKSTRGDSGGYREEVWYVNLTSRKLIITFVYYNNPTLTYRRTDRVHTIAITGTDDYEQGTYLLRGITKDGVEVHRFSAQPVPLENPCEINCRHIPDFAEIAFNARDQSITFNVRSAIADYGQVKIIVDE